MSRTTHYVLGPLHPLWPLISADDGQAIGQGPYFERSLLLSLLWMVLLGIPIAWKKVRGGLEYNWIGYWLDLATFQFGISERTAVWAVEWLRKHVASPLSQVAEMEEGLGRLSFATGLLQHAKPLLGPLYAWVAACPRTACVSLPPVLRVIMAYLADSLEARRVVDCTRPVVDWGECIRLDAKVEGNDVAIGGWTVDAAESKWEARWFALRLNEGNAPWIFSRVGEAFRLMASLELLATLCAVVLLPLTRKDAEVRGTIALTAGTDNKGNGHLLSKLLTTKWPLAAVLIELVHQCDARGLDFTLQWRGRDNNVEAADALSNFVFDGFDPRKRVDAESVLSSFTLLPRLLELGDSYVSELQRHKAHAQERRNIAGRLRPSLARRPKLKDRDPW